MKFVKEKVKGRRRSKKECNFDSKRTFYPNFDFIRLNTTKEIFQQ